MTDPAAPVALRVRPTARGIVAALIGAVLLTAGVLLSYAGLVAFGAGLLALTVCSFASVVVAVPLRPTRSVYPVQVPRHGACTATLRVRSAGRRLAVSLDAVEHIGGERLPVVVPRLAPGATVEVAYPIPTERRGVVQVGPLSLRRVGVAGLVVASGEAGARVGVHVLPRVLPVLGLPAGARRGHVGADERVERGGTDLVALREYVPGDDLRRVHWATSARSGSLMVREDADPSRPSLTVLLDDRASAYAGDEFEDAVEVAASLVATVVDAGHPVRLLAVAGGLDVEVPAAPPGMLAPGGEELLGALAGLGVAASGDAVAVATRDLDVLVAITGSRASLDPLVAEAARASTGVVCVVDPTRSAVEARGSVLLLRGPLAEDLLASWDAAVAR